MAFQICAGSVSQINPESGEWLIIDVGFAKTGNRSCGVVVGDGYPMEVMFSELVDLAIEQAGNDAGLPLNLLLEAPLAVAFDRNGNPTGRSTDVQNGKRRYWYTQPAIGLIVACGHLLRAIEDCQMQRDVRLFEGFVSFKPPGVKSSHMWDVAKLRAAVRNPAEAHIVDPEDLKQNANDRIESAFAFAKMDFGIPPVIFA